MLKRYEEAANNEQYYLLQSNFRLPNSYYNMECGISRTRTFAPDIRLGMNSSEITFTAYDLLTILRKLQDGFFRNAARDKYYLGT